MDGHILLLPPRNGHAQFAAASHSSRGDQLEKTTLRPGAIKGRHVRAGLAAEDRQLAEARAASGRAPRSDCQTRQANSGRPIVAPDFVR